MTRHQTPLRIYKIFLYLQDYSGLLIGRSCNEIFPTYLHCDLTSNTVIQEQFVKKVYYFIVNFVMFFIPVILMSICYSMIIAKLYCSTSPGERIGGLLFVVAVYWKTSRHFPISGVTPQARAKRKVVKLVVVVITTFVTCWSPHQVGGLRWIIKLL